MANIYKRNNQQFCRTILFDENVIQVLKIEPNKPEVMNNKKICLTYFECSRYHSLVTNSWTRQVSAFLFWLVSLKAAVL